MEVREELRMIPRGLTWATGRMMVPFNELGNTGVVFLLALAVLM